MMQFPTPQIGQTRTCPSEIIVPIFGFNNEERQWLFLGTGVFCGSPARLVTANHVLGNLYDEIRIMVMSTNTFYRAASVTRKPGVDLALLEIEKYAPRISCKFAEDQDIVFNKPIYCYEYGTSQALGSQTMLSPATRMGNVTRIRNLQEMFGNAGEAMLELSFPALRGASGSPIVDIGSGINLWGIVVANVSYHLLPAQIESVHREDGSLEEEVRFLLPQAVAVNVKHVRDFISDVGS